MTRLEEFGGNFLSQLVGNAVSVLLADNELLFFQRVQSLGDIEFERAPYFMLFGGLFKALERLTKRCQPGREIK